MKTHLYFKEDTQELKELPINDINCYYLGEFTHRQASLIQRYLNNNAISFRYLIDKINNYKFK